MGKCCHQDHLQADFFFPPWLIILSQITVLPVRVGLMFSSPLSCLTGAAVHPCQRGHRGHGGSHPEDVPEHQWPPTWGEQQPVSALPVCPLRLNRCTQLQTCLGCLSLVFFFASLFGFPVTSTVSLCHLCSSVLMLSCLLLASLPLVFYPAAPTLPALPPLPTPNLIFDFSCSSIRSQSAALQTCSKFTGSSCLYGLWKQQAPRGTWRRWRSIPARSLSGKSSWWRCERGREAGRTLW